MTKPIRTTRSLIYGWFVLLLVSSTHAVDTVCPAEVDNVYACLGDVADQQACLTCYGNSIPVTVSGCQDLENQFCGNFESCDTLCGSCMDEFVDFLSCVIDSDPNSPPCFVDCPNIDATGSGNSTSVGPNSCSSEETAANVCLNSLSTSESEACVTCYINAVPFDATTCQAIEDQFCGKLESCQAVCGDCIDDVIDYFDCVVDADCDVDCPNLNTGDGGTGGGGASSNCPNEENAASTCLAGLSQTAVSSCVNCYNNAIPDSASSCQDIEDQFCADVTSCESLCEGCLDEVISFFDCSIDFNPNFPDCDVDCQSGGGTGGGTTGGNGGGTTGGTGGGTTGGGGGTLGGGTPGGSFGGGGGDPTNPDNCANSRFCRQSSGPASIVGRTVFGMLTVLSCLLVF